ncbi:MAG: hypothetical protein CMN94_03555 [Synechococcus sp. EAC657]|nr:hypothetical protein [Synechococcus sp. EAC657]
MLQAQHETQLNHRLTDQRAWGNADDQVRYDRDHFSSRWEVEGSGSDSGWMILASSRSLQLTRRLFSPPLAITFRDCKQSAGLW